MKDFSKEPGRQGVKEFKESPSPFKGRSGGGCVGYVLRLCEVSRLYLTRLKPFVHRGCSGIVLTCEVPPPTPPRGRGRSQGVKKPRSQG